MKRIVLVLVAALVLAATPGALSNTTYAAAGCGSGSTAKARVLDGIGAAARDCREDGVVNTINAGVNILSIIVGFVAIIMIVYAGFKYITSGGDSNKVGGAKQTLIYALVGLTLAAVAQVLVHFVLFQTDKAVGKSTAPAYVSRLDSPDSL